MHKNILLHMTDPTQLSVRTFYRFFPIEENELHRLRDMLAEFGETCELGGLFLVATEGVNTTFSGLADNVTRFTQFVCETCKLDSLEVKDSYSPTHPFKQFKVEVREEIVTYHRPSVRLKDPKEGHLSPTEWEELLDTDSENCVLLDTRNRYESELGTFKDAICPPIDMFTELPQFLENEPLPKDKNILMFCTGGIRCEKAYLDLKERGYEKVFQLNGGILRYLEQFPHSHFQGECFVFDARVSLDQKLAPSADYKLCPHCGDPGKDKIQCARCNTPCIICHRCILQDAARRTCSKDCAYHFRRQREKREPAAEAL